jgi:hypothetical protein
MNSGRECRETMCNIAGMETVDCQGFQLSPYAADLAEREGIDVGLIKRILDMSPRERIEHAQETAAALLRVMEVGKRFRNGH